MYRRLFVLVATTALVLWIGGNTFGAADEYTLPPVKLKPDRPTTAKPIPPSPEEQPPAEKPAEKPKEPPAPPAEKPSKAPKEAPPAPPKEMPVPPLEKAPPAPKETPPAPEKPAKAPKETVPPAIEKAPAVPREVTAPTEPPPPAAPAKPARPAKRPAEPPVVAPPVMPPPPVEPPVAKPTEVATPTEPAKAPRPQDVQAEAVEAQVAPAETDLTGLGEVALAEEVARARKAYGRALQGLSVFYKQQGAAYKFQWTQAELDALSRVPKTQYLSVTEIAGPELRALRSIPAADQLFTEGVHYKNYPAFPPGKKDYLKIALEKFQTIVEKYPESDKIADAAFRMGEIYGGWYFEDWARAVQAYERCWQWDPKTQNPALFNAAKIYDEKLKNRAKAVELYNRVIAESTNEDLVKQSRERIKALTGK